MGRNSFLNVNFATWFFDLPNLVHRCGYLLNILLDIRWCVFEILNKFSSPLFVVIVRRRPNWSMMSLPMMLMVLLQIRSIVQFFALNEPDGMSTWIVPIMSILLLLKHLNSPIDLFGCFIGVFPFASSFCAVSIFMKLLGLPVSASQNICWLFVHVLIQNSPLFVLFTSETFHS